MPGQVALPAQAGGGTGRLVIQASVSWLAWQLRLLGKPEISINGGVVPAQWGTNVVDLPDGQHNVHVVTRYLWKLGEAWAVEPVHAGQQTVLYYKAPVAFWKPGALDSSPKGYPGTGIALGLTAALVVAVVAVVLLTTLL